MNGRHVWGESFRPYRTRLTGRLADLFLSVERVAGTLRLALPLSAATPRGFSIIGLDIEGVNFNRAASADRGGAPVGSLLAIGDKGDELLSGAYAQALSSREPSGSTHTYAAMYSTVLDGWGIVSPSSAMPSK
jgi:hypothetical protein